MTTTTEKKFCDRSHTDDFDVRQYFSGILAKCHGCGRVLKPTPAGQLRQHQVPGQTTASHDKTMAILWDMARPLTHEHFAIGLTVHVKVGATPAGWPDDEKFTDFDQDDYLRTWQIQGVDEGNGNDPRSTFEVSGWYWYPQDLVSA